MDLTKAQNAFTERLYLWSLADFVHELAGGLPFAVVSGAEQRHRRGLCRLGRDFELL
jgi:hypothetical protein